MGPLFTIHEKTTRRIDWRLFAHICLNYRWGYGSNNYWIQTAEDKIRSLPMTWLVIKTCKPNLAQSDVNAQFSHMIIIVLKHFINVILQEKCTPKMSLRVLLWFLKIIIKAICRLTVGKFFFLVLKNLNVHDQLTTKYLTWVL